MKTPFGDVLVALAVLGMAMPTQAIAKQQAKSALPTVSDIRLTAGGELVGLILKEDGSPAMDTPVQVLYDRTLVAVVRTNRHGRYSVQGLRSGVHQVRTVNNQQICRFWNASDAPPAARNGLLLTTDSRLIRGQSGYNGDCGECCTYVDLGCGDGCGDSCGECGVISCSPEKLLMLGAFGAMAAVTIASSTQSDSAVVRNAILARNIGAADMVSGGPASP